MQTLTPNPSYSVAIRFQMPNHPGTLTLVIQAVSDLGGNLGQIDLIIYI